MNGQLHIEAISSCQDCRPDSVIPVKRHWWPELFVLSNDDRTELVVGILLTKRQNLLDKVRTLFVKVTGLHSINCTSERLAASQPVTSNAGVRIKLPEFRTANDEC
ncbi:hypothetical protein ACFQRB_20250 [Halobaculum litoreum]|uniref:Uncharacterized protein n=1 Tax=Halobaculum litoreum TaxID=3031998 RepID=A0ABD5XYK3_9EURY